MPWVLLLDPEVDAALVGVIACLALLLVYLASTQMFRSLVRGILGWVPFVGGNLADAADSIISAVVGSTRPWLDSAADPFIKVLNATAQVLLAPLYLVASLAEWTVDQLASLGARLVELSIRVDSMARQLPAEIGRALATLATLTTTIEGLRQVTQLIIGQLIPAAVAEAESVAGQEIELLRVETTGAIDAATAVWGYQLGQAIDGFESGIAGLRDELTGLIDGDMRTLSDWLGGLSDLVGDVNVPALALEVATVTATVETIMVECVNPVCGFWGPSMGLLTLLQDGATIALIVALLAEARSDPDGAARVAVGVGQDVYNAGRLIASPFLGG